MSNIFDLFRKIEAPAPAPISHLVVGLGNPGREYEGTRHNIGFAMLDAFAARAGASIDRLRFHALCGEGTVGGHRVLFMKPQTFMNLSGTAVAEALSFYKIPLENLIVFCDDVSFDVGRVRIRRRGTHGGHNGLRHIIEMTGGQDFPRVRVGVGKKPRPDYDLADWVLGRFPQADREALAAREGDLFEVLTLLVDGKIDEAMNRYST